MLRMLSIFMLLVAASLSSAQDLGSVMLPPQPTAAQINVQAGQTVVWQGEVRVGDFYVAGTLEIKDNTFAVIRTLHILPGGKLIIGSVANPVSDVTLNFAGQVNTQVDPFQWRVGLLVQGEMEAYGSIVTPSSYGHPDTSRMDMDGRNGIVFARNNYVDGNSENGYALDRAIRIVGGHTAFLQGSKSTLYRVVWSQGGRSRLDIPADDTYVDEDGILQHVGTNQNGRYPVHWHHAGEGPHYVEDSVVRDSVGRWGFTVHSTSNVTLEKCLTWNVLGAGFYREETGGSNIVWNKCLALASFRATEDRNNKRGGTIRPRMFSGKRFVHGGRNGDGFWTDSPWGMSITNCKAIGCWFAGFQVNGYYHSGHDLTKQAVFDYNESIGCEIGYWQNHASGVKDEPVRIVNNLRIINAINGVWTYHASNIIFHNLYCVTTTAGPARKDHPATGNPIFKALRTGIRQGAGSYRNNCHRYTGTTTIIGFDAAILLSMTAKESSIVQGVNGVVIDDLKSGCAVDAIVQPCQYLGDPLPGLPKEGRHTITSETVAGAPTYQFPWGNKVMLLSDWKTKQPKHSSSTHITYNGTEYVVHPPE